MEIKENTVYNCDCLEMMREMARGGVVVDWIITDPPYGIGLTNKEQGLNGGKFKKKTTPKYTKKDWDTKRLTKEYFDLMFKVSKNQLIFGGNYYTDYLPPTKSWVIWDKRSWSLSDRNDFADCEMAWCSTGQARLFRYMYNGAIQENMKMKEERFHPTQKPVCLFEQLINYYTKPTDLIFDPFMGSFTTAVACHKTGRKYLGCELDQEYFKLGSERLNSVKNQISMFD